MAESNRNPGKPVNFVTFDIEEWYSANYATVDVSKISDKSGHLEKNVDRLLEICENQGVKATHFVVGDIARNKPTIVKKIHDAGHEVASHSYAHELIYQMTPEKFREDLRISCDLLAQITGEKVTGFRAPSWSVNTAILPWFYTILHEQGIRYSSSVFPGHTFLYGIPGFPEKVHQPVVNGVKQPVWEIPQTLFSLAGKKFGFSGGFYLRALPAWFVIRQMKAKNDQGKSIFLYLHPREIDKNSPRLKLGVFESLIHYYGVPGCEKKFRKVISAYSSTFVKMGDFINEMQHMKKD